MVADALSRKSNMHTLVARLTSQLELHKEFILGEIEVHLGRQQGRLSMLEVQPNLLEQIKA